VSEPPLRLRELIDRLVSGEVSFVLVGGLAVNAWGYVRGTQDVDIVPDPSPANLERLAAVLDALKARVEISGELLSGDSVRTFLRAGDRTLATTELGAVDVLQGIAQVPPFAELDHHARSVELGETTVRVCSLEHLIAMKQASSRPRDIDDLEALVALRDRDGD